MCSRLGSFVKLHRLNLQVFFSNFVPKARHTRVATSCECVYRCFWNIRWRLRPGSLALIQYQSKMFGSSSATMSGAGCSSSFPGTRLDFFKLQHWLVQSFELSNHDCRHATPFISEASSFPNNIPATFRVCGTKSCGIRFSRPLQAFGSECMSVFDSCGFDFQTPTG